MSKFVFHILSNFFVRHISRFVDIAVRRIKWLIFRHDGERFHNSCDAVGSVKLTVGWSTKLFEFDRNSATAVGVVVSVDRKSIVKIGKTILLSSLELFLPRSPQFSVRSPGLPVMAVFERPWTNAHCHPVKVLESLTKWGTGHQRQKGNHLLRLLLLNTHDDEKPFSPMQTPCGAHKYSAGQTAISFQWSMWQFQMAHYENVPYSGVTPSMAPRMAIGKFVVEMGLPKGVGQA